MKLQQDTLEALRQRRGLFSSDSSQDAEIAAMSPTDKFKEILTWHLGDPAWAESMAEILLDWAEQCGLMGAPEPLGYANPVHIERMRRGGMGSVTVMAERDAELLYTQPVYVAPASFVDMPALERELEKFQALFGLCTVENKELQDALRAMLSDYGYSNASDEELQRERSKGNRGVDCVIKARAALKALSAPTEPEPVVEDDKPVRIDNRISVKDSLPPRMHWTESCSDFVIVYGEHYWELAQYDYDAEKWRDSDLCYIEHDITEWEPKKKAKE